MEKKWQFSIHRMGTKLVKKPHRPSARRSEYLYRKNIIMVSLSWILN